MNELFKELGYHKRLFENSILQMRIQKIRHVVNGMTNIDEHRVSTLGLEWW